MKPVKRGFVNSGKYCDLKYAERNLIIMLRNEDSMQVTLYCGDGGAGGSLDGLGMWLQNGECKEFFRIHMIFTNSFVELTVLNGPNHLKMLFYLKKATL